MIKRSGPGRPQKTDEERVVIVRLGKGHVNLLDEHIEERSRIDLASLNPHRVGERRRKAVGELIEKHLSFDAKHPGKIVIFAPSHGTAKEQNETADWIEEQEKRLLEDAPDPIKRGVEMDKAAKLMNLMKKDPDKLLKILRDFPKEKDPDELLKLIQDFPKEKQDDQIS